jgi:hypothetical protein
MQPGLSLRSAGTFGPDRRNWSIEIVEFFGLKGLDSSWNL